MHSFRVIFSIAAILFIILVSGSLTGRTLEATSEKLDKYIVRIENNAKAGQWDKAQKELLDFRKEWAQVGNIWAMLLDHAEIDNIDSTISRMWKFIETKDTPSAMAEIATLRQYIEHIPERESFSARNIF